MDGEDDRDQEGLLGVEKSSEDAEHQDAVDGVEQDVDQVGVEGGAGFKDLFLEPEGQGGERPIRFVAGAAGQALAPEVVAEDVGKGLGKVRTFGQVRIPDDGGKVVEDEAAVEGRKVDEGRRDENEDSWNHGRLHAWLWS